MNVTIQNIEAGNKQLAHRPQQSPVCKKNPAEGISNYYNSTAK